MPRFPPVTTATFPSSSIRFLPSPQIRTFSGQRAFCLAMVSDSLSVRPVPR
jgi:hypothetical protein